MLLAAACNTPRVVVPPPPAPRPLTEPVTEVVAAPRRGLHRARLGAVGCPDLEGGSPWSDFEGGPPP